MLMKLVPGHPILQITKLRLGTLMKLVPGSLCVNSKAGLQTLTGDSRVCTLSHFARSTLDPALE